MPALFGGMGANQMQPGLMPMEPPVETPKRRRGLFGALSGAGDWLMGDSATPGVNRLQTIGATLKDIGGAIDGGGTDNLINLQLLAQREQQQKAQQAWQSEEQARRRQEWQAGDAQTQAINTWISTLPPDQQMLARVNPEAAQKMFLEAQKPKEPKYFNTGQAVVGITPDGQTNVLYRDPVKPDSGAAQYKIMSADEVKAAGLPPGSYKMNTKTGDVVTIGRQKAQYTEFAGKSAQFADRTNAADRTLTELENKGISPQGVYIARGGFGSEGERRVRQAQREFVNAILRLESGAAIGQSEFDSAAQQYFPQPGDNAAVIQQKREARQRAIQGLKNSSQGAYDEWYPEQQQAAPPPRPKNVPPNAVFDPQTRRWKMP